MTLSIDHLFLFFSVAKGVWAPVYNQCCFNRSPGCWESELAANQFQGKPLPCHFQTISHSLLRWFRCGLLSLPIKKKGSFRNF